MLSRHCAISARNLCAAVFASAMMLQVHAQEYDVTNLINNNVKSYSVTEQTDIVGVTGHPVLEAGTLYNYPTPNWAQVHFLNLDDAGNVNFSQQYGPAGYTQARAVSIIGDGSLGVPGTATYYIISQIRPFNGADDQIRIQPIDYSGVAISGAHYIASTNGINPGGLVPLNAVYNSYNGLIYICGYHYTDPSARYPGSPSYLSSKQGFVLSFDPVTRATNITLIETGIAPPLPKVPNDYDIAMRVSVLTGGDIHVTGSVNAIKSDGHGGFGCFSATMNIHFTPTLTVVTDDHFTRAGTGDFGVTNEYGIGFVEGFYGNYILGNRFWLNAGSLGGGTTGFATSPSFMFVNWIDPVVFNPGTFARRHPLMAVDFNVWGLQLLKSSSTRPGYDNLRIVGQQDYEVCGTGAGPATINNVLPFITDIDITTTVGGLTTTNNQWMSYENLSGTGTTPGPNAYPNLGCDLDVMGWNCTNATRNANRMVLTAPKWDAAKLNFKTLRVNDATLAADPNCSSSAVSQCFPATTDETVTTNLNAGGYIITKTYLPTGLSLGYHSLPESPIGSSIRTCSGSDYKNPALGVAGTPTESKSAIFPNPASGYIHVTLADNIQGATELEVTLVNTNGQQVAKLYTGSAADLRNKNKLLLPEVAKGMYHVQVAGGNKILFTEKLSIQ